MAETRTVNKIKLIDNTVVNLSNGITLNLPDTMSLTIVGGTVTLISGTTSDYLLTIQEAPAS